MKDGSVQVIQAIDEDLLNDCLKMRGEDFVNEKKVPKEIENDQFDYIGGECDHFLIRYNGESAGALRCKRVSDDTMRVQRFCILSKYRGKGIGRLTLFNIEKIYREKDISHIELDSKCSAKDFYLRCGYRQISDVFVEAGVEHVKMSKDI